MLSVSKTPSADAALALSRLSPERVCLTIETHVFARTDLTTPQLLRLARAIDKTWKMRLSESEENNG